VPAHAGKHDSAFIKPNIPGVQDEEYGSRGNWELASLMIVKYKEQ